MKLVYLDWGVISSLKKEENNCLKDLLLSNKDRLFFVYSPCHFEDLMRSKGTPYFDSDVKLLSNLVDDHLLNCKEGKIWLERMTPEECCNYYSDNYSSLSEGFDSFLSEIENYYSESVVSAQLKANLDTGILIPPEFRSNELFNRSLPGLPDAATVRDAVESCRLFLHNMMMTPGSYKEYRRQIADTGFKLEMNAGNWKDEDTIDQISMFLRSKGINMSFDEYLAHCFHSWPFTWVEFFTSAYCILDMMGFHSDKLPKSTHTLRNMTTDAKHAVFASTCDWFISADDGLCHKSKALYSHFGISTCVMTPTEVFSVIELVNQSKAMNIENPGSF